MEGAPRFPQTVKQDVKQGESEKQKVISISERKKEVGKQHLTN